MERALKFDASIIGINHRDLDTLVIDLSLTERLSPEIRSAKGDVLIVAESGVESREGRKRIDPHVDAILIGTGLIKNKSISDAWKKIFD
jgi:indole-3-glycerol phosphate synthase